MALVVNTNINALTAQEYLSKNQAGLSSALNHLSSGLRVLGAQDDAAGLAIANTMEESIRGLKQGSRNANDAISLTQTAQSAMQSVLSNLQRMRELATQASTGTYSSGNLTNLNAEYSKLLSEIDRVTNVTTFNGISLLANSTGSLSIQVGATNTANDRISVSLTKTDSTTLAINTSSVTSASNAQSALDSLDTAIQTVTTGLANLGANESNLQAAISSNNSRVTNLQAAQSRIMDADMAEESGKLAKYNILNQTGIAMLAQANSSPNMVLQLLRG